MGTQPNSRRLTRNPKYVTIRNLLRDHILAGRYGPGNESRQGKGHFVRPVRAIQDLGRLQGFGAMMAAVGVTSAPNYCLRYRAAARQGEALDTSACHIGFRCVVRRSA